MSCSGLERLPFRYVGITILKFLSPFSCFASPVFCISPLPLFQLIASFDTAHPRSFLKKAVWEKPGRAKRPGSMVVDQEGLCRVGKRSVKTSTVVYDQEGECGLCNSTLSNGGSWDMFLDLSVSLSLSVKWEL